MNDCGAKSKLSAPLIYLFYLSKTGNYSYTIVPAYLSLKNRELQLPKKNAKYFAFMDRKGGET
jgi:hypothetical protein